MCQRNKKGCTLTAVSDAAFFYARKKELFFSEKLSNFYYFKIT